MLPIFNELKMPSVHLSGFSSRFPELSQSKGQVPYVLLTRSPLTSHKGYAFDLHVLGMPPAFILSQDQTLRLICLYLSPFELFSFF